MWASDEIDALVSDTFLRAAHVFDVLTSTNDEAKRLGAELNGPLPLLIVARRQTHGRGRGSNHWISAEGALTFSLVVHADKLGIEQHRLPVLSLWTALGVQAALAQIANTVEATVKWPNDVLVGGKKIAGILLEAIGGSNQRVVVGIGINVNNSLATSGGQLADLATSLCDVVPEPLSILEVLRCVLSHLQQAWARMKESPHELPERWHCHDELADRVIQLTTAERPVTGQNCGVDEDGAILIEVGSRVRAFRSGSVGGV